MGRTIRSSLVARPHLAHTLNVRPIVVFPGAGSSLTIEVRVPRVWFLTLLVALGATAGRAQQRTVTLGEAIRLSALVDPNVIQALGNARNAGADFLLRKPADDRAILDAIAWVTAEGHAGIIEQ